MALLRDYRGRLHRCAQVLLDKETLEEAEILSLTTDLRRSA